MNSLEYLFLLYILYAKDLACIYALLRNDKSIKVMIYKKIQNHVSPKCQLFLGFLDYTKEVAPWISIPLHFFDRVKRIISLC